jgi:hypothetical protein
LQFRHFLARILACSLFMICSTTSDDLDPPSLIK